MKPLLGVLGGMGTQATARFYEMLHNMQDISAEQEYLDVLVYSKPTIPDRTAYILGKSDKSPLSDLLYAAKTLENAGATCLVITCLTSHFFYEDLAKAIKIPILNMPEETARFIADSGIKKVGLLATDGALKGRVFHTTFEKSGIEMLLPPESSQSELMEIIYSVKCAQAVAPDALDAIAAQLRKNGARAVILGCTELSLIAKKPPDHIDVLEVLAKACLRSCKTL